MKVWEFQEIRVRRIRGTLNFIQEPEGGLDRRYRQEREGRNILYGALSALGKP
jgi:hypothetical protein